MTDVLVVDDSRLIRTVVGNALTDAGYTVETASDGKEAIDAVSRVDPDVITMDVEMPEMNGLEAIDRIMSTNPTPILMVSAHTEQGAEATLDALDRGAMDFLHKPDRTDSRDIADLADTLVETVDEILTADVSSLALARASAAVNTTSTTDQQPPLAVGTTQTGSQTSSEESPADSDTSQEPVIIIGASTGGPKIVERILVGLPTALEAKILVVQHMPESFTDRFANRLDGQTEYDVREARQGDRIEDGEVLIAPGDAHVEVTHNVGGSVHVDLTSDEPVNGVIPSIDVTMKTAAEQVADPLIGVALSGMGCDGAAGIEAISNVGGYTIAQDEETSPVFGIPDKAIETGCVDDVLPAQQLVEGIVAAADTEDETDE